MTLRAADYLQMFVVTGVGLTNLRYWRNDWKRPRYNTDQWDRVSGIATEYLQRATNLFTAK